MQRDVQLVDQPAAVSAKKVNANGAAQSKQDPVEVTRRMNFLG